MERSSEKNESTCNQFSESIHGLSRGYHIQINNMGAFLTQPARLTLRLHQSEDVSLTNRSLDVTHDEAVLVVQELDADLRDLSTGPGPADDLHDNGELDSRILRGGRAGRGVHSECCGNVCVRVDTRPREGAACWLNDQLNHQLNHQLNDRLNDHLAETRAASQGGDEKKAPREETHRPRSSPPRDSGWYRCCNPESGYCFQPMSTHATRWRAAALGAGGKKRWQREAAGESAPSDESAGHLLPSSRLSCPK